MGFDTNIRKEWSTRYAKAFGEEAILTYKARRDVFIVDLLTYAFTMRNANGTQEFTGTELVEALLELAIKPLDNGQAAAVVLCIDYAPWVPKEKVAEQKKRDNKSTHHPYPKQSMMSLEGIHLNGVIQEKANTIDVRRMLASRGLRAQMWVLMREYLKKKLYVPPENTMIIMDHWSEGAYCFSPSGFIIHKTPSNSFGEADLKAPYWVSQLARDDIPNHTIMVKSTDSDFTMTIMWLVHTMGRHFTSRVILSYWRGKWLDVRKLYQLMEQPGEPGFLQWLGVCIFCGTDYVDRASVMSGMGPKTLSKYLLEYKPQSTSLAECDRDPELFDWLIRHVYARHLKIRLDSGQTIWSVKPPTLEKLQWRGGNSQTVAASASSNNRPLKKAKSLVIVPSSGESKEMGVSFTFNLKYWKVNWEDSKFKPQPPLELRPDQRLRAAGQKQAATASSALPSSPVAKKPEKENPFAFLF